jgi:hypothetical protein
MRLDLKLAIVQSGQPQYAIAQQIGVPESRLSKFIHGYGTLRQEQVEKLKGLLGLKETANAAVHTTDGSRDSA